MPRKAMTVKHRSGFKRPEPSPCLTCFKPSPREDAYCARCEETGAAKRHRERNHLPGGEA